MQRRNAFTLIELLVVISIIALLIGILLPALGAARKTARQLASNTQLRGIHQSMVVFAQENKTAGGDGYFPGLDTDGTLAANNGLASGTFYTQFHAGSNTRPLGQVRTRYSLLLADNFITPEYIISPADPDAFEATARVIARNFSYCMSDLGNTAVQGYYSLNDPINSRALGRSLEWKESLNSSAVVMSDMNTGANNNTLISSLWTEENSGAWEGGIVRNDNSVSLEQSEIVENTQYAQFPSVPEDSIFVLGDLDSNGNNTFDPNFGSGAVMILNRQYEFQDMNGPLR